MSTPISTRCGYEARCRAAAMEEELRVRPALDGVEEPFLARLHERDVLRADHPAVLGGHVVPVGEDVDVLADLLEVAVHGLDVDVRDLVHQPLGERSVRDHRHHELLEPDGPARLLEDPAADDPAPDEREVRVPAEPLRLFAKRRDDLRRVGLRPTVRVERLERQVADRELDPVVVERARLWHPQLRAPRSTSPNTRHHRGSRRRRREPAGAGPSACRPRSAEEILGEERELLDLVVDRPSPAGRPRCAMRGRTRPW